MLLCSKLSRIPASFLLHINCTYFTVRQRVEGCVDLGTAVRVCSLCPILYLTVAVVINTTVCDGIQSWDLIGMWLAI